MPAHYYLDINRRSYFFYSDVLLIKNRMLITKETHRLKKLGHTHFEKKNLFYLIFDLYDGTLSAFSTGKRFSKKNPPMYC